MKTITDAAKIVGLSRRMIQEYEKAGVAIKPTEKNKYGYLIYDDRTIGRLWQIRFYKELGYDKNAIKAVFDNPSYDHSAALTAQIELLEKKKQEIDNLINVAKLMKDVGLTPQSLQPRNDMIGTLTFNDSFGLLSAISRQIDTSTGDIENPPITDEQFDALMEAFERGVSIYKEGFPVDGAEMQEAIRTFHNLATPVLSQSVFGLWTMTFLIAPGSEGGNALEEEYQLPGLAGYLQDAVVKYCENNFEAGVDKLLFDTLDEMVALGIAKHSPSSDEVQTLAAKVHDFYKTAFSETMLSPAELMKSFIETFRDPSAEPVFDKVLQARGASRYIAKALSHYYNNHLEELQTITKTMED